MNSSQVYMNMSCPKLNSKKDQCWANETDHQFTCAKSTSTQHGGVFARGPSSLISSRKRLEVVKGGFSRQRRRSSSSLIGTLDRTMFAFDLCTATLMRWKNWRFSAAWTRRLLTAHRSATTVKNDLALEPNPLLVFMAKGINPDPLWWQSSAEALNFLFQPNCTRFITLVFLKPFLCCIFVLRRISSKVSQEIFSASFVFDEHSSIPHFPPTPNRGGKS